MSKLPKTTLSLKQFLVRQEVLGLYREILRTIRLVPDDKTKTELREWARNDFRNNMYLNEDHAIKSRIYYGRKSLKDLRHSLALSN